ncbi:MAG: hypothetical protein Q7S66_05665 [bacterium]|nr:hypothetical protein [bacterium]
MDIFFNPWVIGIGTTVGGGLILYYVLGVGNSTTKKNEQSQNDPRHAAFEADLASVRNRLVSRGVWHSFGAREEVLLREKHGLPPAGGNEIQITVGGKIYWLTNQNNNSKYSRAKNDAGPNATPDEILAHYDKLGGYIQNEQHEKVLNGRFWQEEKERQVAIGNRKEIWRHIERATSHPVVASFIIIILLAILLWYIFGIDLSRFQ